MLVAGSEDQGNSRRVCDVKRREFAEPRKVKEADEVAEAVVEPEGCDQGEEDDPEGVHWSWGFRGLKPLPCPPLYVAAKAVTHKAPVLSAPPRAGSRRNDKV